MTTTEIKTMLTSLRDTIDGAVALPGDADWDDARQAWNLAVDQHPAAVVLAASVDDVIEAVRAARAMGLRVAVQGTGHGAAARSGLDQTLLLNMRGLRGVTIDASGRQARTEAGALWEDVVAPAAEHGLAALHGSSPDVAVVGYTLSGGIGWLARRHGLAGNAVTAIEVVTANGERIRASETTHADLFWALRGGGGSFGVVTAIEFTLFPVETVHAGWLIWPWEEAGPVLARWAEWAETVPDDVTSIGRILQLPPIPEIPEPFRGRQLVVVEAAFLCDQAEADALLAPLRALTPEADTFATAPAATLSSLHMDPYGPTPGIGNGGMLDALPAEAIETLVAMAGPGSGSPFVSVEVRHLGGALGRIPPGAGVLGHLDGRFALYAVGIAASPELAEAVRRHLPTTLDALAPWGHGRQYLNFSEQPTTGQAAFDPSDYQRLREIKAAFDPDNLIRSNHEVPPAG